MPSAGASVDPTTLTTGRGLATLTVSGRLDGEFAQALLPLVLALHRELSVDQVALTAVNEGRALLNCDRLSLAAPRRGRMELLAVSGQERIITRSNLVRAMTDLATALGEAQKPLRFDGDVELLPPQLRQPVLEYLNQSGARSVEAIPLRTQTPSDDDRGRAASFATGGWLLCEHFGEPGLVTDPARAQAFADHIALALANAQQLERQSTPLRRALRHFYAPSESKNARKAAIMLAAVLAAIGAVGLLPVRYRVEAPGRLTPVRRCEVFAPAPGRVQEVLVEGNQSVKQGQVLVRLANERLDSELLATRHLLDQKQQMLATLEAQSAEAKNRQSEVESIRLSGAVSQTKIEIAGTQSRLESLTAEAAELEIRAPIDGAVTTFDPRRALLNRPVERGETLLEVMDTSGPWELELDLPAKRVGHVLRAQAGEPSTAVPVQFTLATEPETTYAGALRTVSSRIVTGADAESVAPLKANVAVEQIAHPVAGADVIARVDCGQRALAGVLFGDVVDYVRSRVW